MSWCYYKTTFESGRAVITYRPSLEESMALVRDLTTYNDETIVRVERL